MRGRVLTLLLLLLSAVAGANAEGPEPPEYRVHPTVTTVTLDQIPTLRRLDVPGRPRLAGVMPDEIAQVAPAAGRILIASGGFGRLYRPGTPKPLWSGPVDGMWALSPDGRRLAVAGPSSVVVRDLEKPRRTRWLPTRGPARPLFSRDGRRLLLVDGQLRLETYDLGAWTAPSPSRLFRGKGMLESMYLFPDGRTLFFNLQRERGNGSAYCRDLRSGATSLVASYNAVDWSARYAVSWDGRYVWSGSVLPDGRGCAVVSDVSGFGVRGEDETPIRMQTLMTWFGTAWRPGVASVGQAVAYAIEDRVEILDPAASTVTRIVGWPVQPGEDGPGVLGFLEPQQMLAVQLGPSIFLVPVRFAPASSTPPSPSTPHL